VSAAHSASTAQKAPDGGQFGPNIRPVDRFSRGWQVRRQGRDIDIEILVRAIDARRRCLTCVGR